MLFCSLKKGITPNICMCFVKIAFFSTFMCLDLYQSWPRGKRCFGQAAGIWAGHCISAEITTPGTSPHMIYCHTWYIIATPAILPHMIYYHTWYITTAGYICVDLYLPDFSVMQCGGKLECELDIVFLQRLLHLVQLLLLAFLGIMVLHTIYCNVISCNVIVTQYQFIAQQQSVYLSLTLR